MGREIRRVPPGWEHPKDERGNYKPLFDETYEHAAAEWLANLLQWESDENADERARVLAEYGTRYFWDWDGPPPEREMFRPAFDAEPTCYQIYETVTEGTPTSPVFETLNGLALWLVAQGYSRQAAENFARDGWAPSMVITSRGIFNDIESAALAPVETEA